MSEKGHRLWRIGRGVLAGLDLLRRTALNALFLILLVMVLVWLLSDGRPTVPKSTALVVAPQGNIVEQLQAYPTEQALFNALGQPREQETLLRTVLRSIREAKDDERVKALFLDLNSMGGSGLVKLQLLREAIEEFKASGKQVVAASDFYGQGQYYLASSANEVHLHHMGMVLLTGFGSYRNYYKDALDKLAIDWNVFKVGEYKSAVEPYLRNDMSPEAREARETWLGELWGSYREDVESSRGLTSNAIQDYVEQLHLLLEEHDGLAAEMAKVAGLVDHVSHRDEVRKRMIELVGEDKSSQSFHQIGYKEYLQAVRPKEKKSKNKIALVVAKGAILPGTQAPGSIGGDSTARLIRDAREDESVKAIVLRVDSPGGSAFASELIRREVELAKAKGLPVVASMSGVAASGGYWISMSADEIWASPNTITGSIGIFAMFPTFERLLSKLGVSTDGVGTGPLAGSLRADRSLSPEAKRAIQSLIDQGYDEFITRVAEGRDMTPEEVDEIARGRVWSGQRALELGLIDSLGDLQAAVQAAADRAELGDDYRVAYFERQPSTASRLLQDLLTRVGWHSQVARIAKPSLPRVDRVLKDLGMEFQLLRRFDDPRGMYAYCFCGVE